LSAALANFCLTGIECQFSSQLGLCRARAMVFQPALTDGLNPRNKLLTVVVVCYDGFNVVVSLRQQCLALLHVKRNRSTLQKLNFKTEKIFAPN